MGDVLWKTTLFLMTGGESKPATPATLAVHPDFDMIGERQFGYEWERCLNILRNHQGVFRFVARIIKRARRRRE